MPSSPSVGQATSGTSAFHLDGDDAVCRLGQLQKCSPRKRQWLTAAQERTKVLGTIPWHSQRRLRQPMRVLAAPENGDERMRVVLFCGGYGLRMRDGATDLPKPMTMVGHRPLLWHVMRYYAHHGHTEFVLCLGYGAQHVKDYFLNYRETASNDFVLRDGGSRIDLLSADIANWTIHFVDTGVNSPIGERLRRVRHLVADEEAFLANYADVLTDAPLPTIIDRFLASDATACLLAARPDQSFHCVDVGQDGRIRSIRAVSEMGLWINGGNFVLRQEVFDHIPKGGDLVGDACSALAARGKLLSYCYTGFWHPTDTIKERNALETRFSQGDRPWMVWETDSSRTPVPAV
jgi:glucose-1-phosphate cytidylyltransferase